MKKQLVRKIDDLKQFKNFQPLTKSEIKSIKGGNSESIIEVDIIMD